MVGSGLGARKRRIKNRWEELWEGRGWRPPQPGSSDMGPAPQFLLLPSLLICSSQRVRRTPCHALTVQVSQVWSFLSICGRDIVRTKYGCSV